MKFFFTLLILYTMASASELKAMQDACERDIAEACYELGMLYSGSTGLKPDKEKTNKYYKKACNLNHDKSCLYLKNFNSSNN